MKTKSKHQFKSIVITLLVFMFSFLSIFSLEAQRKVYNLKNLMDEEKLLTNSTVKPMSDGNWTGISIERNVWLKGVSFSEGTIELDIRGKDLFQNSFVGIAFHGVDTTSYDCIYFRPFNFQSSDTVRKSHSVQYINPPKYEWFNLREQFPGKYENGINPPPLPNEWFHAKIVVKDFKIWVYVNNSNLPSLEVEKLNKNSSGMVGLWTVGSESDFANLSITK